MGYLHIDNLYKNQEILMFKECYALEKVHGTSAHISWNEGQVGYFAGGASHPEFISLFDNAALAEKCRLTGVTKFIVYGEAYGGKMQGMKATYGDKLKFVAFDVKIDHCWLSVPQAEEFCNDLGIEFVAYEKIPTDLESIDRERDRDSVQAVRNGMGDGHKREGVVLRPLIELKKNNQARIMAKHKIEQMRETKTKRPMDPEKLKILSEANEVAEEWVTPMRLNHVLDKIENPCMEKMGEIIRDMVEDVKREGEGEIVWSKPVGKAIGKTTAKLVKQYFQDKLKETAG